MRTSSAWLFVLALGLMACGDSTEGAPGSGGAGGQGGSGGAGTGTGGMAAGTGGMAAGTGGATGSGGAGGAACTPKTNDASNVNVDCNKDEDCAQGYVCQQFVGVVVTNTCQILCGMDCDCPAGLSCEITSDKSNTWMQCTP